MGIHSCVRGSGKHSIIVMVYPILENNALAKEKNQTVGEGSFPLEDIAHKPFL